MQFKVGKPKHSNDPAKPKPCLQQTTTQTPPPSSSIVHVELATSWPVTILWILLSWLVSTLATTAYVHPEWYVREDQGRQQVLSYDRDGLSSTLGMVSVCYKGSGHTEGRPLECHNFEEDFPSNAWQSAYVMFGSGCVLLTWCSILAFCNVWIVGKRNRQLVATLIGRIQLVAALLQAVALLLYPIVLGSPFARLHCGAVSQAYVPAGCRIGWAYIAAIASTVLACYCPLLAHFSHYNIFSPCLWTEI